MALSQAQKKIIENLSKNPSESFDKIKNNHIDLNSFKNEFYKDGDGLIHKLINGVIVDSKTYLPIITYVLENSILSLDDKAQGKESAMEFYIDYHKHYFFNGFMPYGLPVMKNAYSLIKANSSKNSLSTLYNCLFNFKKYSLNNEYEDIAPLLKDKFTNCSALLREIILKDDVDALKNWFILNPTSKDYFLSHNFFIGDTIYNENSGSYISNLRHKDEKSNVLVFAINKNAEKISHYLIDNSLVPLNGNIINEKYVSNNLKTITVHAISQCLANNNYNLYEKICERCDKKTLTELLISKEHVLTKSPVLQVLDLIMNHSDERFKNLIITNSKDIMNTNHGLDILYAIISSSTKVQNITDTLNYFLPYLDLNSKGVTNINNIQYFTFANRFFSNLCSRDNLIPDDYQAISDCLFKLKEKGLLLYDHHMVFTKKFFQDETLFDALVKGGLDLKNTCIYLEEKDTNQTPINLLQFTLNLKESKNGFNLTAFTDHNINILKKIKSAIGENALINNNINNTGIVQHSIFLNYYAILDLYSNEELKTLIKQEKIFIPKSMHLKEKQKFESFILRCIECDINFCKIESIEKDNYIFKNHPLFYKLLNYNVSPDICEKILTKEKTNIIEYSQDSEFWAQINSENMAQYVKSKGVYYNNSEVTLSLCKNLNLIPLELYLKNGGNVDYIDHNQDRLLHVLIKGEYYKQADLIINYHSELISQTNRQNKFAISYLLEDLNKYCKNLDKVKSRTSEETLKNMIKLVQNTFSHGFDVKNKKPVDFLKSQLAKYQDIFKNFPDLQSAFSYGLLQKKVEHKIENNIKKKNKL